MDETLGYKVVSLVSVGAGMTQDTESIRAAKPLLVYFWEQHIYSQSLEDYLFTFLFCKHMFGIGEQNILKSVRAYLAAFGTR